jgi:hypothetical protein
MKEVPSLFTFAIGALCFVVFVTVFKPGAVGAVPATSKPAYCNTEGSLSTGAANTSLQRCQAAFSDRRRRSAGLQLKQEANCYDNHRVIFRRVQHGNDRSTQFGARYI